MKVNRILSASPKTAPAVIPVSRPVEPGNEIVAQNPFTDKPTFQVFRWRIAAIVQAGGEPKPKYATHISYEIGRCSQEAWSRFVYGICAANLSLGSRYTLDFTFLSASKAKPSLEKPAFGFPLFPKEFYFVKDRLGPLTKDDISFSDYPKTKPVIGVRPIISPLTKQ